MFPDMNCVGVWVEIEGNEFAQLLSVVKNRILDFVLQIEPENPNAGEAPPNEDVPDPRGRDPANAGQFAHGTVVHSAGTLRVTNAGVCGAFRVEQGPVRSVDVPSSRSVLLNRRRHVGQKRPEAREVDLVRVRTNDLMREDPLRKVFRLVRILRIVERLAPVWDRLSFR